MLNHKNSIKINSNKKNEDQIWQIKKLKDNKIKKIIIIFLKYNK
jgi:hypothetical protein